jgi:uncharacterized protein (DUF2141 family)
MFSKKFIGLPALRRTAVIAAMACLISGAAAATTIYVQVTGVDDTRGHVRVELCTRQTFLTGECPYSAAAPATSGETVVEVEAPPGEYAVQAYHDDTDSGRVHRNLVGIPRERIGFSNNAPLRLHGPSFDDAAFQVGSNERRITLRLRHIIGK